MTWFKEIEQEVERSRLYHPLWPDDPIHAVVIVAQECGELQKAILKNVYDPIKLDLMSVRDKAIQTAAVCVRFLDSLDRYELRPGAKHKQ